MRHFRAIHTVRTMLLRPPKTTAKTGKARDRTQQGGGLSNPLFLFSSSGSWSAKRGGASSSSSTLPTNFIVSCCTRTAYSQNTTRAHSLPTTNPEKRLKTGLDQLALECQAFLFYINSDRKSTSYTIYSIYHTGRRHPQYHYERQYDEDEP